MAQYSATLTASLVGTINPQAYATEYEPRSKSIEADSRAKLWDIFAVVLQRFANQLKILADCCRSNVKLRTRIECRYRQVPLVHPSSVRLILTNAITGVTRENIPHF